MRLALYADALRHAQPSQLAGRVRRALPLALLVPRAPERAGLRPVAQGLGAPAAPQHGPVPAPHEAGELVAYGAARAPGADGFWTDGSDGLLFLFHLHGFAPLAEYVRGERSPAGDEFWRRAVESWLESCHTPALPAWHPYPTSVRVCAWAAGLSAGLLDGTPGLQAEALRQLARQARYLRRAIERDIGGNHVLKNGVALVFGGAVLTDGDDLLETGLRVLQRECAAQFLGDGGHLERSPSYHREAVHELREVATLLERLGREPPGWLAGTAEAGEAWMAALAGPDGRLPLLNDSWEGPPVAGLGEPLSVLAETGYAICRAGRDQLVFDAAPLAPAHLPPHAHADALSVVAWFDGEPLVIDPGSFTYSGAERDEFRSTAAHSTVEVDGADQCRFWGPFRASFMPRVALEPPQFHQDGIVVLRGSHDGYRRLADPVRHERTVIWAPGDGLVLVDSLDAGREHDARSSLPLAPGTAVDGARVGPLRVEPLGAAGAARRVPRRCSPWLGRADETHALEHTASVGPGALFGWSLLREGAAARLEGGRLELDRSSGARVSVPLASR